MALSDINPSQALSTRAICVEMMKVPSFMLKLCLKYPEDLVGTLHFPTANSFSIVFKQLQIAFLTGMLLGNDQNVRSWFAVYIRSSQKRKADALNLVRAELLLQLQKIILMANGQVGCSKDDYTMQGAILMRLYCALRGIAGLK